MTTCALARTSDGRAVLFQIAADHSLWSRTEASPGDSKWTAWGPLGVAAVSDLAVVADAGGDLWVFALADGQVQLASLGTGWAWHPLAAPRLTAVAAALNSDGRLEVFGIAAADGALWHAWQSAAGGAWTGWLSLGGSALTAVVAGRQAAGPLFLAAASAQGVSWRTQGSGPGGWTWWAPLPPLQLRTLALATNSDGRLELFGTAATDGAVWHAWQGSANGPWTGWLSLGAQGSTAVAVARAGAGPLQLYALTAGGVQTMNQAVTWNGWSPWTSLGSPAATSLVALGALPGPNANGQLVLAASAASGVADRIVQATGGWSAWFAMGAPTASTTSTLSVGERLPIDGRLTSPDGSHFAVMQGDGNFCSYLTPWRWVWGTQALPPAGSVTFATLCTDGTFAIMLDTPDAPTLLWSSQAAADEDLLASYRGHCFLAIDNSGGLTAYYGTPASPGPAYWTSLALADGRKPGSVLADNSWLTIGQYLQSPAGNYHVVMQADGRLCVYVGSDPAHAGALVWASAAAQGSPPGYFAALFSGALAVFPFTDPYARATEPPPPGVANPTWAAPFTATAGAWLALENDGRLIVRAGTRQRPGPFLWTSGTSSVRDQIQHVVVLMLENRGFDTAVGYSHTPSAPPSAYSPAAGALPFHGPAFEAMPAQVPYHLDGAPVTSPLTPSVIGANSPGVDPGEPYPNALVQLFGPGTIREPATGTPPSMNGFVVDWGNEIVDKPWIESITADNVRQIMRVFTPADLPVLNTLASGWALCDRWFASVPTQTNANRAYSICGTSRGEVNNGFYPAGPLVGPLGCDAFDAPTVWNALSAAGHAGTGDWMIYYNELYPPAPDVSTRTCADELVATASAPVAPAAAAHRADEAAPEAAADLVSGWPTLRYPYTYDAFPQLQQLDPQAHHFATMDQFFAQAAAGSLPRFSYLEPKWGGAVAIKGKDVAYYDGNEYHPPVDVTHSELALQAIHDALARGPAWSRTLLLVFFDEHGGTFDHVPPPWGAHPPWGSGSPTFPLEVHDFHFDRYGVRIPAMVVSPWAQAGLVFRSPTGVPFDHASMISSVLEWFGVDYSQPGGPGYLGERVAHAPTFWTALTRTAPRTDDPFVRPTPATGSPLHFGDGFSLVHVDSDRAVATAAWKVSTHGCRWFPTLGGDAIELQARAGYGPVSSGAVIQLRTSELQINDGGQSKQTIPQNTLGSWKDSQDCYYASTSAWDPEGARQHWTIARADGSTGPIRYGDIVTFATDGNLVASGYLQPGWLLNRNFITTGGNGSAAHWKIMPPPGR